MTATSDDIGTVLATSRGSLPSRWRALAPYVTVLAVTAFLIHAFLVSAVPYSVWVSANSYIPGDELKVVVPQGWGFFTRDPQEPRILPYAEDATGTWEAVGLGPHSQWRWLLGFNRRSRAQGVEIGTLFGDVPEEAWHECQSIGLSAPEQCLRRLRLTTEARTVSNPSSIPTLCGTIGLVAQEPLPWAWRDSADSIEMPARALLLEVECRS